MKRMTALLLCFLMIVTMIPINAISTEWDESATGSDGSLVVVAEGVAVNAIEMHQYDQSVLRAETAGKGRAKNTQYRWQIMADAENELWVDIHGENEPELSVSYAMVVSLLDSSNQVWVRCVAASGAEELVGEPVCVTILPEAETKAGETAVEAQITMPGEPPVQTDPDSDEFDDETVRKYILSIEYIYGDTCNQAGNAVAPTWSAEISSLQPYDTTITSPTVPGYEADQTEVEFQFAEGEIDRDYHIVVKYLPANVSYTVKHFWQNIDDDNYEEHAIETMYGLTESLVPSTLGQKDNGDARYEGFEALPYAIDSIAADGSTVVEIYYDRVYYLMTFELNGGYGTLPIYARYGTSLTIPDPTKVGNTFMGWDADGDGQADSVATTMPNQNTTYRAIWKPDETVKVSVVFWGENPNDTDYSYIKSAVVEVAPGSQVTFTENMRILICGKTTHAHSSTCKPVLTCTTAEHSHSSACCTKTPHTHSTSCYNNVGYLESSSSKNLVKAPSNPADGYLYRRGTSYSRVIYINGNWYRYTANSGTSGTIISPNNSCPGKHAHGDGNCTCALTAHTHDDNCYGYSCGLTNHTHQGTCYQTGSGMDTNLWIFESSTTVTAEEDGSSVINVKYTRKEFTLTFKTSNSSSNAVATIKRKWGASIADEFLKAPFNTTYNGRAWKCTETSKYSYALQTLDIMPKFDATFTLYDKSSSTLKTIYYYIQIPGTNVSETTWPTNTNNFTLLKQVDTYFKYATYAEEYHEMVGFKRYTQTISGFTGTNGRKDFKNNKMELYYLRETFTLEFNNGLNIVETKKPQYGQSLAEYASFVPEAPELYEKGSVYFAGWYLNPECTGNQFILTENTMPPENMILYAKWEPVEHIINVYRYRNSDGTFPNNAEDILLAGHKVLHGNLVPEQYIPEKPADSERYKFDGWFYIDENGNEQAFDFYNIPVTSNLNIYVKWKTDMLQTVTVRYVTIKDGAEVEIAAPETFNAYVGTLKTYEAKTDTQLYEGYRNNYYPTTASSSVTVSEDEALNTITFYYVESTGVPYRVEYLIRDANGNTRPAFRKSNNAQGYEFAGNDVIAASDAYVKVVDDNTKAVVTENYIRIASYVPDAMQKRLIITTNEENNVIQFIYTYDPTLAYYTVNHYIINPGVDMPQSASDYELYPNSNSSLLGVVGETYDASPVSLPGMTFSETVTVAMMVDDTWDGKTQKMSTQLEAGDTTELNFFYTRNYYEYQVRYVDAENGSILYPTKTTDADGNTLTERYGDTVTEYAVDIEGYKVDADTKYHIIRIGDASRNTITFYYSRKTGDLEISKSVILDPDQKEEDPSLQLPDGALSTPFAFVVSAQKPFYKSSFSYTITHQDETTETGTVSVKAGSYDKILEPVSICHGDTIVIHDLALGDYTVREEPVIGYKSIFEGNETEHINFRLDTDGQTVVTYVVNAYPFYVGDLLLSKKIIKLADSDPDGTGEKFTFHVTIRPDAGTLDIDRTITYKTIGNDGQYQEAAYTIPAQGYGDHTFTLILKAGDDVTIKDIPMGNFTVVETIPGGHYVTDYYKVTYDKQISNTTNVVGTSNTVNGVILAGHVTEVGYHNTYKKGDLTIEKTVTKEVSYDDWTNDSFAFKVTGTTQLPDGRYDILVDGQEAYADVADDYVTLSVDPTLSVTSTDDADSWMNSIAIENLPAGVYQVEEISAGKGLDRYVVDHVVSTDLKLPIIGVTATAQIDNIFKRSTGSLFVSKEIQIVGNSLEPIDQSAEFDFTVIMPSDGDFEGRTYQAKYRNQGGNVTAKTFTVAQGQFTFKLKHGENIQIDSLPVGAYTISEAPKPGYASSFPDLSADGYAQVIVNIKGDQTHTQPCINAYPVYVGDLRVQKTVTMENPLDVQPDDSFKFVIQNPAFAGKSFSAEGVMTSVTADAAGKIEIELKHGEEILITNLPVGQCTVTEVLTTDQEEKYETSYEQGSGSSGSGVQADIEIVSGHEQSVGFTNMYKRQKTDLVITRTNAVEEDQVFVYEVRNTHTGEVITVTVTGNGSARICNLPFGTYTVTQINDWSWRYGDDAQSVTLDHSDIENGDEVTFSDKVAVRKWLDGNSMLIRNMMRKGGGAE